MASGIETFLSTVKDFFIREIPRRIFRPKTRREVKPETPADRRVAKERAAEIIDELKRITPSHPAAEILNGAAFDKDFIQANPDVGNFLIDIIHAMNIDPAIYHEPKWIKDKLREIRPYFGIAPMGLSDRAALDTVATNLKDLFRRSQKDRRETDVEEDIRKVVDRGEDLAEEDITTGSRHRSPANLEWNEVIDSLETADKNAVNAVKTALDTDHGETRLRKYEEFSKVINSLKKEALRHVDPRNPNTFKEYHKLQKVFDKLAADFTTEETREGGRMFEALHEDYGRQKNIIEKRIQSDENYRDYWFYHILENILYNHRGESHRDLFGLYEHSDMQSFLEIVRRIKDERGEPIGRRLAERYDLLKNTIFQSHDMDYYAAHPQQDMKEFIGSTSLFLNQYIDAAVQDPMVSLAKRLYEKALLQIRESNNGFIPRQWLQWEEGKVRASKLDDMVEKMLKDAIGWKQLYVTKIDPVTKLPAPSVWNRKQIDTKNPYTLDELYGKEPAISEDWRRNLGDLKIASALKQAKGLTIVDERFLEIIALSKGTGTDFVNKSVSGFSSVPYEGIVKHIEPIIHYFGRYKVGMDTYDTFFNMMITEGKTPWEPQLMKEVIRLHTTGQQKALEDFCKKHKLGDLATRLTQAENPFSYSGMWGTKTKWRIADSTADFDDWERDQAEAASVKLTTAGDYFSAEKRKSSFQKGGGTWAYKKAQQYYVEHHSQYAALKEQYRQQLLKSDDIKLVRWAQLNGQEFELQWRKVGLTQKVQDIKPQGVKQRFKPKIEEKTYGDILLENFNNQLDPKRHGHPIHGSEAEKLIKKLERAYKARTWVQVAMRSPSIAARELEIAWNKDGYAQTSPLRKKIIWEILHVDLDNIAALRTPLAAEEAGFNLISDLEGAVSAVEQIAIRENRDLAANDFNAITDEGLKNKAVKYWEMVRESMFGGMKDRVPEIYNTIGMKDAPKDKLRGLRFLDINWDRIKDVDITSDSRLQKDKFIIQGLRTDLLNNALIDRDWQHLFSTEDMGWEYLNIGALGERNPVRRAGDLGSHVEFGQLFEQYMNDVISKPKPKLEDIVEAQHKMLIAMSGDFLDIGVDAVGRVAYTTGQIYRQASWVSALPFGIGKVASIFADTSMAQILHGRDRGDAWGPNDMLHYVQAVGSQILPKNRQSRAGGREIAWGSEWDRALLGKRLGATKTAVAWEIVNMTLAVAFIITLYRAMTAKSEEEE